MRLICPKCAARYEVPGKNVPSSGREVQCSACGYTWFQTHPSLSNTQEPVEEPNQKIQTASQEIKSVRKETEPVDSGQLEYKSGTPLSRLHPTVAEVLKEEARREVAVRAAENLETEVELGIDEALEKQPPSFDAEKTQNEVISSIAPDPDLEELEVNYPQAAQTETGSRGSNLLYIKEINSSLNSGDIKKRKSSGNGQKGWSSDRRRMKRMGLFTGILIVVCFFLIYQFAVDIGQVIPHSEPLLDTYVQLVDWLRTISDQWIARAIAWLEIHAEIARRLI